MFLENAGFIGEDIAGMTVAVVLNTLWGFNPLHSLEESMCVHALCACMHVCAHTQLCV